MAFTFYDSSGRAKNIVTNTYGIFNVTEVSSNTTLDATHHYVGLQTVTAAGAFDVTLPNSAANSGKVYVIMDVEANAEIKNVTIKVPSGDKLDGVTNGTKIIATNSETVQVVSHGSLGWFSQQGSNLTDQVYVDRMDMFFA